MANLNTLPDLSTVDIQAIQDSVPILPRPSLPPLTTIAENWDSIEPTQRNSENEEESCSEEEDYEDSDDEEERSHSSTQKKIKYKKSQELSCSSSSAMEGSLTGCSDSELSDITSDSEFSSSSSSGSDSDSHSSNSSSSTKSSIIIQSQPKDHPTFSVREANYEQGRVTLRLAALQLGKKSVKGNNVQEEYSETEKPVRYMGSPLKSVPSPFKPSPLNAITSKSKINTAEILPSKPSGSRVVTPIKLRRKSSSEIPKTVSNSVVYSGNNGTGKKVVHSNGDGRSKAIKVTKALDRVATKRSTLGSEVESKESSRSSNIPSSSISNFPVPSSQSTTAGPMLSDLDSDGDELYLPAVSEAIRMLDLDSQGSSNTDPVQSSGTVTRAAAQKDSASTKVLTTSSQQPTNLGLLSLCNANNSWPTVGCCSSILQQFAAKSRSGEPPLPHLPVPQQLTKGARKSFPPNDEPVPAVAAASTGKNKKPIETMQPVSISAGAEHDLDVLVPMRGLDCHPSHVSPDSGIQSVSGSPFSVHSSPIHPGANCNSQQPPQQQMRISPCPPRHSPSPPPQMKPAKSGPKRGRTKQSKPTEKSPPVIPPKNIGRRPRSCRDTATALSSGLEKDSSFVQAIQRGLNDALRLTGKTNNEKEAFSSSKDKSKSAGSTMPAEKQRKGRMAVRSVTKGSSKRNVDQEPISVPKKQPVSGTTSVVTEKDPSTFRNEIAAQLQLLISKGGAISAAEALGGLNKKSNTSSPSNSVIPPVKRPLETSELVPFSPRQNKRKKKRKKHKSSNSTQEPGSVCTDPNLQRSLELLCQTLDRCSISRVSIANSVKIPCIFQCRKYATGTTLGTSGRPKRKKTDEDLPFCNTGSKRKSKMKKNSVQENHLTMPNTLTEKENEPAVIIATELSLPLKKRHHHLPATESQVEETIPQKKDGSVNNNHKVDSCSKDLSSEKPSQDQVLLKSAVPEQHLLQPNRKRAASGESTAGTYSDSAACDTTRTEAKKSKKKKKMRGRKKYKEEVVPHPVLNAEEEKEEEEKIVATLPIPPPPLAVVPEQQVDGSEQLVKKRGRRRKAFNRTGFPTAKKKRKKVSNNVQGNAETVATTTVSTPISAENSSLSKEQSENVVSDMECTVSNKAKKPRLLKDDDSDILLPEPTSSESPSSDELAATAVLLQQTGLKKRRVPRWRKRYLTAGLFSNYFKEEGPSGSNNSSSVASNKVLTYDPEEHEHGLLPPPFHCERWLRRRKQDFQLPFDLWWLHHHGKLPGRDTMIPSWNYRKIRTNVYYDVKPPFSNDAQACNCKPPPLHNKDGDSSWCGDDCLNRMVYTECSSQLCPNEDRCSNQRIQRHMWAQGLERFMTKEKGWGVRCRNELKAGQFILEYVGEVVSEKEFKERMRTVYAHDTHHYCLHLDGGLVIDGHRMGGDGRFVNHSCSPNCEMQKWSVNGLPRMALFALRDIMPYEELSYDYNFSLFNPAEGQPCKCGSLQCRGVIGGKSQRVNMHDSNNSHLKLRGTQQKRKRKRQQPETLTVATCTLSTNLRPLSVQQRAFVQQHHCFLIRNLETVRRCREREKDRLRLVQHQQLQQHIGRTRRVLAKNSNDIPALGSAPIISTKASLEKCIQGLSQAAVNEEKLEFDVKNRGEEETQEEIVNCRCRLFHEEGLMVQCERCETWQHSDCLGPEKCKAAVDAEHYVCDSCLGILLKKEDLDIVLTPQPDNPPEGLTFYLSLYYKDLQVRQGDCVYVLRDHDTPDSERTLWNNDTQHSNPSPRCPRSLPSNLKLAELDIFQIERMWIDEHGKKYIWGHHYLRPHETFHEPSRKFYVNEVLHVPIYEAIPIWAVAGRCWVLDPITFCKGRPVDAVEQHVYICEFRVDRSARLFAKVARSKFSFCTRKFAFKTFTTKLKPQRTYQPHGAPPPYSRKTAQQNQANESLKDNIKKGEVRKEIKKKKKKKKVKDKAITLPAVTPIVKATEAKSDSSKIEGQRKRLDEFLYKLLSKNTSNEIEDATHLLHNRGRTRGRRKKLVAV